MEWVLRKQFRLFVTVAALIMLAACIVENINHRFWLYDFQVYYKAAQAMISGKQVYGIAFDLGSGYYKYSPFTALLYAPLSLLPYNVACFIQYAIISVACVYLLITVFELINKYLFNNDLSNKAGKILFTVFVCFAIHIMRELHMGNINFLLLLALLLAIKYVIKGKYVIAALLMALVIITKPFFVLLLAPVFLHKYYKVILFVAGFIVLFIILPGLFIGFQRDIELHKEWLHTMIGHADSFPSPNTLDAIIKKYLFDSNNGLVQYVLIAAAYIAYFILFYVLKPNKNGRGIGNLLIEWFTLIALMPTLFRTDTQHFLLTAPLLVFICSYLYSYKSPFIAIVFGLFVLMYDTNSTDLWGRDLSGRINEMGLLGVSNILLIGLALIIYFRQLRSGPVS